jgi:hypothetical protein
MTPSRHHPVPSDPIVDEVRAIRARLWKEADENFETYKRQLREFERGTGRRVVSVDESIRRAEEQRERDRLAG